MNIRGGISRRGRELEEMDPRSIRPGRPPLVSENSSIRYDREETSGISNRRPCLLRLIMYRRKKCRRTPVTGLVEADPESASDVPVDLLRRFSQPAGSSSSAMSLSGEGIVGIIILVVFSLTSNTADRLHCMRQKPKFVSSLAQSRGSPTSLENNSRVSNN